MKLNTNSNSYTILYACGVVVVVAFLLATVSQVLKPAITANERIDTKKQILSSLHLKPAQAEVEDVYASVVTSAIIVDTAGTVVDTTGGFEVKRKEISDTCLPVFICQTNDATKYVLPMVGKGLWGGIWGYMAVNADCETVYGIYFGHESETAGLGALIATDDFSNQFVGKRLTSADASHALSVVKNGSKKDDETTQCDGISGATLTGNGVSDMLQSTVAKYKNYLLNLKNNETK